MYVQFAFQLQGHLKSSVNGHFHRNGMVSTCVARTVHPASRPDLSDKELTLLRLDCELNERPLMEGFGVV